jgi:2-dehydropantoate 2-reductase
MHAGVRRKNRAANGLHVFSPLGDFHIASKIISSAQDSKTGQFDAVGLSCKAYDLDAAIDSVALALAPQGIETYANPSSRFPGFKTST